VPGRARCFVCLRGVLKPAGVADGVYRTVGPWFPASFAWFLGRSCFRLLRFTNPAAVLYALPHRDSAGQAPGGPGSRFEAFPVDARFTVPAGVAVLVLPHGSFAFFKAGGG